ncbi:MAG: hypothetical protein HYS53_01280 [Candidatus Aenigmarchaeota archaeon]|nr:hypothetical protein [Candidatus Aenigmarchaeota archaeon]
MEPTLYEAGPQRPGGNFHTQMSGRLARIADLLNRTRLVYKNAGVPVDGVHVVVGMTGTGDPYLFSVLGHRRNEVGGMELGIFSGDEDFIEGVRTRMETNLPPWVEVGETHKLKVWRLEGIYALMTERRRPVNVLYRRL